MMQDTAQIEDARSLIWPISPSSVALCPAPDEVVASTNETETYPEPDDSAPG
jgi:hypothetical protein